MWDTGDSVRDFWDTVWDSWVSRLDNAAREAEVPPSEKSIGCGRPPVGRGVAATYHRLLCGTKDLNVSDKKSKWELDHLRF